MFGFFIKKNFFDGWDNCLYLLIPNVVIAFFLSGTALGLYFLFKLEKAFVFLLAVVIFVLAGGILASLVGANGKNVYAVADYGTPALADYFKEIPAAFKKYFGFGCLCSGIIVSAYIGIPVYLGFENQFGVAFAVLLGFFVLVMAFVLQWFIPLTVIMNGDFKKTIKKCFIIFFDNTGFSFLMFLYSTLIFLVSCVIFLVLPGLSGVLLGQVNALRLRLYKYDWLEVHPDLKTAKARKNIPWDDLLKEDRMNLGSRNFRSLFNSFKANDD